MEKTFRHSSPLPSYVICTGKTEGKVFMNQAVLFIFIGAFLVILPVFCYRRYPFHLIYKSKTDLQEMLDGIEDPWLLLPMNT